MLNINIKSVEGVIFTTPHLPDPTTEWTTLGYGQDPKSGVNYVVGTTFDSVNNRSRIATFLIKDVEFKGQLSPAAA